MPRDVVLNAETAARNMAEIEPAYTPQEAVVEANRCLFCFDAPCIAACPTGIDIPAFIKKITTGNRSGSARTILQSNILGASCARVCPTSVLCEGACVMLDRDEQPIKIGRLQRYATDYVFEHDTPLLHAPAEKSGKRIALIGGGPASLGCAAELAQLGHEAVIFEKKAEAGGLNTYGIAYYKLTPETSLKEVELVQQLGVEIRTGVEVGKDISMADLQAEFDAIFLGVGLGHTYSLDIPGEDLPEVVEALAFIEEFHVRPLHEVPVGRRVAVIGCGNTAIDAVTQAKRLGAEQATIIYRRGENDMPAYVYEYNLAKRDGAEFVFHAVPVEVLGADGHVTGLKLAKTEIAADGRLRTIPGSEYEVPCDMVIKALGQEKMQEMLHGLLPDLQLRRNGSIETDPATGQTNLPTVFAGGDGANGGAEVVNAVGEGKKAARGIHKQLTQEEVDGPVQWTRMGVTYGKPVGAGLQAPIRVPEQVSTHFVGGN
jgi:dihydropyrimidine dehydrogenase (NAD+) subunit PreT